MENLVTFSIFNVGFFGGQREAKSNADGHYHIISDGKEFGIVSANGYGGFKWLGNEISTDINSSGLRVIHDHIYENKLRNRINYESDITSEMVDTWNKVKKHKLYNKYISANIQRGDKVIDLLDGKTFIVDHDITYINRNHNYKLVDRPELHPDPVTLEEFLKVQQTKENEVWKRFGWKVVDGFPPKKGNNWVKESWFKVNDVLFETLVYDDGRTTYYIKSNGVIRSRQSSISAPYYDTIRVLMGYIYGEYIDGTPYDYCVYDIESSESKWVKGSPEFHTKKFNHPLSYRYNTRLTYL